MFIIIIQVTSINITIHMAVQDILHKCKTAVRICVFACHSLLICLLCETSELLDITIT